MQTLGDAIMIGLVLAALIIVPYKLFKVWVYPHVQRLIMSHWTTVPTTASSPMEQRSYAVERPQEPRGTEVSEQVPDLVEQLEALDDDTLLDILSRLRNADGEYRYAESRIAKFIPGRVEDRLTQVREVRHTEKPAPPGRVLRVRDQAGERVIPFP